MVTARAFHTSNFALHTFGAKRTPIRVFSYRIFYKIINENQIAIIGVVHGYRLFDPSWVE
jgi:hypothetical protein